MGRQINRGRLSLDLIAKVVHLVSAEWLKD